MLLLLLFLVIMAVDFMREMSRSGLEPFAVETLVRYFIRRGFGFVLSYAAAQFLGDWVVSGLRCDVGLDSFPTTIFFNTDCPTPEWDADRFSLD